MRKHCRAGYGPAPATARRGAWMRGDESECKGCTRGSAGCHACSTNMSSQARGTGSASESRPALRSAAQGVLRGATGSCAQPTTHRRADQSRSISTRSKSRTRLSVPCALTAQLCSVPIHAAVPVAADAGAAVSPMRHHVHVDRARIQHAMRGPSGLLCAPVSGAAVHTAPAARARGPRLRPSG